MSNLLRLKSSYRRFAPEAARRLAVTLPFFAVSLVVLARFSGPQADAYAPIAAASEQAVLIVTARPLAPAFEALVDWNRGQGCPTYVVSLERVGVPDPSEGELSYLSTFCALRGVSRILLGGDARIVADGGDLDPLHYRPPSGPWVIPVSPGAARSLPDGFRMGRAPVRTLGEAWDFVAACRTSGKTLDVLLERPAAASFFAAHTPAR